MAAVRRSTVDIGRAFEQHALAWCNGALHMSLRPVGGKGDGGVDLRGWWFLPRAAAAPKLGQGGEDWRRLRVVGQCKAERKALGPRAVRELEGVVAHLLRREHVCLAVQRDAEEAGRPDSPFAEDSDPETGAVTGQTLAVLLSQSGFSSAAMQHATRSGAPMMLVHLPGGQPNEMTERPEDILVSGAWWNPALGGRRGLLAGDFELRREILDSSGANALTGDAQIKSRLAIYHQGIKLDRLGPALPVN